MFTLKSAFQFLLLASIFTFASCNKDDEMHDHDHEEELITTLTYTLTPDGGGDAVVLSFQDVDGDGGNAPTITTEALAANTTYTGVIELLNEAETPSENVTEEIEEEGTEHQFFFATDTNITTAYTDMDNNNLPIGLASTLTTTDAGTGNFTITLRHEPDKNAEDVRDGDITNAGGETDIEVTFAVVIE